MTLRSYSNYEDAPAWLRAADAHNSAAHNTSFFDNVMQRVRNTPDFITVSAASAANSFYNSGVSISNVFRRATGQETQEYRDTGEWISSLDDDLGKYYEEVKGAADLTGFIASSLIPGLGGVRLLGAGQAALRRAAATGEIGSNLSRATGLLAPSMQVHVRRNAESLIATNRQWSLFHGESLRTIRAGAQQGVLEGIAFEAAVMATMHKSPVFDEMDTWDMVKNMTLGVAIGGGVGTIVGGAAGYFGTSRLLKLADQRQQGLATGVARLPSAAPEADKIVTAASERARLGQPVSPEDILEARVRQGLSGEDVAPAALEAEARQINSLREQNLRRLAEEQRTSIRALTPGKDDSLGNAVADLADRMDTEEIFGALFNARQIVRASQRTSYDVAIRQLRNNGMTAKQAREAVKDEAVGFVQLHSGTIGDVLDASPGTAMRLADKMTPESIRKFVKKKGGGFAAKDLRSIKNGDELEARWLFMRDRAGVGSLPFPKNFVAGSHDLPVLEKAVRDGINHLTVATDSGERLTLRSVDEIADFYRNAQLETAQALREQGRSSSFIERATNIRRDYLEGSPAYSDDFKNFNAQASYAEEFSQGMGTEIDAAALHYRPKYAKVVYDTSRMTDEDGNILRGMQQIKYREVAARENVDRAFAAVVGDGAEMFTAAPEELIRSAWRGGKGAGLVTNAGGAYGSFEQWASYVGMLTSNLKRRRVTQLQESMENEITSLLRNPEDAVRFSTINEMVAGQVEKFVLNESGTALIPRKVRDYELGLAAGKEIPPPRLAEGTPNSIPLETAEIQSAVRKHIELNAKRNVEMGTIRSAQGLQDRKYGDTFYPVRQDPRQFKHVMFVKDNSLSGVGHTRMIIARDADELAALRAKVPSQYQTYTKGDGERFFQARGEWEYDKTLHENYLDVDLNSRGIRSSFFPQTDPQRIVDTWLQDQIRRENALVAELVTTKYQKEISELRRMGEMFSDVSESTTAHVSTLALSRRKNPYEAQIKSMLDITKVDEHPLLMNTQQWLDERFSSVWNRAANTVREAFGRGARAEQEMLDTVNNVFSEVGFKSAYYDATIQALANSQVPRGKLTTFVRRANAFLTTTILRWDPFNALNNVLGNNVILSAEVQSLTKAMRTGDAQVAGDLAAIAGLRLPGTEDSILSGSRLIANSLERLHGPGRQELIETYRRQGLLPDLTDQYYKALDALTLTGTESAKNLTHKSQQLMDAWKRLETGGTKLTGNAWAEQFNRLLAADVMKQITDVAVKHGILDERMAWSYVNTMVNRVNGVVRAAERPLMFQGPVGQAMGLFQSYQFNLIQQTLRHIGEGRGKTVAMLAGMQTSIYGASSLPGFSLINNHLVGNAAGNPDHQDLYSLSQVAFGDTGARWLMYGAPSNILGGALYTRGDTNPRTWHVVPNPTNPTDIPFIGAFTQAFGSMRMAAGRVAEGAPVWESFLSGVEHMGLSRPMAGIAATARAITHEEGEVYSTQRSGNFLYSHDLMSMATLMRIAGARPMDEAVMQNDYFRIQAYAAADRNRRNRVGEALRTAIQAEGTVPAEAIEGFAERYVQLGGNAKNFNQFMIQQYKNATVSQAEQMAQSLSSPYGRAMQRALGGRMYLSDIEE